MSKSKYADSVVELDARIGRIMDKLRALGLDKNTLVFYTTDNGAWQDVYPDAGYTPFRGTKGTVREGGNRVPAIAVCPGKIKAGTQEPRHRRRPRPDGDLRLRRRRDAAEEGPRRQADHLRQLRHDAGAVRHRQVAAQRMVLLHRERADARARRASATTRRCSTCAATTVQPTGGLAVDSNLGWKGPEKYVAIVPQVFDLWQDPQERYDIFMNNYTERTWTMVTISEAIKNLMKTYVQYPPRKLQSMGYTGPIELSKYQQFQWVREQLEKDGVNIPLPTGN